MSADSPQQMPPGGSKRPDSGRSVCLALKPHSTQGATGERGRGAQLSPYKPQFTALQSAVGEGLREHRKEGQRDPGNEVTTRQSSEHKQAQLSEMPPMMSFIRLAG